MGLSHIVYVLFRFGTKHQKGIHLSIDREKTSCGLDYVGLHFHFLKDHEC